MYVESFRISQKIVNYDQNFLAFQGEHICNHFLLEVDWGAVKVVAYEQHLVKWKVLESLHVREQTNTSNLDSGYTLRHIWKPLLT